MGLKDKLREFEEKATTFVLPDGSKIGIKPVNAMQVVPRLGLPPMVLKKFFEDGSKIKDEVEKQKALQTLTEDADIVVAGLRWADAYWALGITSLDGEPVKLAFNHEEPGPGEVTVDVFKAFLASTYGQTVVDEIQEAIQKLSGYILPEEVKANAEAFQDAAHHAAHAGEGVRHEPGGNPENAAGGAGPASPDSAGGSGV